MQQSLETSRKSIAHLAAEAPKRRNRAAAGRGIPAAERESYKLAILPRIPHRPSRLPQARRDAFESHLRSNLSTARARLSAGETLPPAATFNAPQPGDARSEAERDAERQLLGAGCASCRGFCCLGGGDKAYNHVDTMVRYLQTFPTHDDEAIVARFLSYIATHTLTGGCVYQHEHGCTLPRDLRADICNQFFCSHLDPIRNEFAAGEPVRAYFVHVRAGRLAGGRFVNIPIVD